MRTLPRILLSTLGLFAGLLPGAACGGRPERPGVPPRLALLVTVAGLRADHTSMLLHPLPTTDKSVDGGQRALGRALGLDDLAAEGVLFARAFAPSCDPLVSLGALLTARSPVDTGILGPGTAPGEGEECLAEVLGEAGLDTVAFVTHGDEALGAGWQQGFDRFAQFDSDLATLGALITWIGEVDLSRGRPMLLWVHLEGPRFPFQPGTLPMPGGVQKDFGHLFTDPGYDGPAAGTEAYRRGVDEGQVELSDADRDHVVALYDGEVALVNELLFRFFDFLRYAGEPSGTWDRTLLVVAGTGGVELPLAGNGPRWGGEECLTDGVLRVPLFVRHPDSLTGRRIFSTPVELQDLAPTLWELFGCERPAAAEGRSLLALTDSYVQRDFPERPLFSIAPGARSASVREDGWRLVLEDLAGQDGPRTRLIHAELDRRSLQDLSAREPARLAELRGRLEDWLARLP